MAKGQRQRKSKTSNGSAIGSKKMSPKFTEVAKVLLGGGMVQPRPKKKK